MRGLADGQQILLAALPDQLVANLVLPSLVDAYDAPGHVIVHCRRLARQPDQSDDGKHSRLLHMQDVLTVALGIGLPLLQSQQSGISQERPQDSRYGGRPFLRLGLQGKNRFHRPDQIVQNVIPGCTLDQIHDAPPTFRRRPNADDGSQNRRPRSDCR